MGRLTKDFEVRRRGERGAVPEQQSYGTNANQSKESNESCRRAITVPSLRAAAPLDGRSRLSPRD
jgi:hypothetical protein